ncbi:MAG: UDP-N-acetylmuramoylalanyl-D-glutamyl-2,6-diaminopimelate--D-alanyl-D-alanine ligase [Dongiaceae bacterium]
MAAARSCGRRPPRPPPPAAGRMAAPAAAATGVSIDSRTLAPGDLFVALRGPTHDGHDHVAAALAAGAAAAVVDRVPTGLPADAPLLLVADTMAALEALGADARRRSRARFVAVTGSVGKTGTKEAIALALGAEAPTYASPGNLNNQWGVPLSLARLPPDVAYAVFELGMNHAGEILALTRQVRPDVAVVTTVEAVHLEFFDSVAGIADAKAEIFAGMAPAGVAVLNRDNAWFDRLAGRARDHGLGRIIGFGRHPAAEARLLDCSLHASCSAVSASILGERLEYCLAMPGLHWALNSLAVLAAVQAAGGEVGPAAAQLARLKPLKGRGQRLTVRLAGGPFEVIDESYNASPPAVTAALGVLGRARPGAGGRRIAVLGDMLELGRDAPRLHAALAGDVETSALDLLFTAGPLMRHLHDTVPAARRAGHAADSAALAPLVAAAVRPGDIVLVKGSLGSRMAPLVDALRRLDTGGDTAAGAGH